MSHSALKYVLRKKLKKCVYGILASSQLIYLQYLGRYHYIILLRQRSDSYGEPCFDSTIFSPWFSPIPPSPVLTYQAAYPRCRDCIFAVQFTIMLVAYYFGNTGWSRMAKRAFWPAHFVHFQNIVSRSQELASLCPIPLPFGVILAVHLHGDLRLGLRGDRPFL